jgi:hypothetical protein
VSPHAPAGAAGELSTTGVATVLVGQAQGQDHDSVGSADEGRHDQRGALMAIPATSATAASPSTELTTMTILAVVNRNDQRLYRTPLFPATESSASKYGGAIRARAA